MTDHLRVNPAAVTSGGNGLGQAAASVPPPPGALNAMPAGDPLSAAGWAHQQTAEIPVIDGLPQVQSQSADTAGKTVQAARMYESTDTDLGTRLGQEQFTPGSAAAGGGNPSGAAGGAAASMGTAGQATSQMAGALGGAAGAGAGAGDLASGLGGLTSAMSMPMQMASQLAQIPAQLGGALASAPQGLMSAATSGMGQLTGMVKPSGGAGEGAAKAGAEAERAAEAAAEEQRASGREGERAPVEAEGGAAAQRRGPDERLV